MKVSALMIADLRTELGSKATVVLLEQDPFAFIEAQTDSEAT